MTAFEFDQHRIPVKEHEYRPVEAPDVRHPSRQGWVNRGRELYIARYGAEAFEANSRAQFLYPMPDLSPARERELCRTERLAQTMFATRTLLTGRRGTHFRGVAARGTIDVVAKPEFPEHDFFTAGRRFPCRLRHANASFDDDAVVQVRGCALKFADADFDSPYDLVMNTGATAAFWCFWSFMDFAKARVLSLPYRWKAQERWFRRLPVAWLGTIESLRSLPTSYADMSYYSKIAYPFKARDGRRRYAKYRILRPELELESGQINDEEQRLGYYQSRLPGNDGPYDLLGPEFIGRLSAPLEYRLQIQLWDWEQDRDSVEVLNLCRYWDEDAHPWLDLATVTLTEPLPSQEMEVTRVWLGHQPPSLGISAPTCTRDYRSLAWARVGVYPHSQRASEPMGRLRGLRR
ncbi:hypothetical protein PPSIR1_41729 [Plesiocystis pacifica SIR-1]|uniref:Catalase n=1 Tax=Plesiocystis pacifica SIR-1 TaxID=391625 RepID=A6G0T7_9BACT|nr:hypothetical protein [Plesiocystis pacifica]EDM80475.1 hypothetical protein PPSIR1_41729 [Plesiocystis pacifica SIR-1]